MLCPDTAIDTNSIPATSHKTLSIISSSSQSDANTKAPYWDWRRESSVIPHSHSLWERRHVANVAGVVAAIVYPGILLLFSNILQTINIGSSYSKNR
jgi:hypothetical protein